MVVKRVLSECQDNLHLFGANAGQSGSPVYNTHTNTVYGIHVAGGSTVNYARRFTKELYDLFVKEKWIG